MIEDEVSGVNTNIPLSVDDFEQIDFGLEQADQEDLQPDITKAELEMLARVFERGTQHDMYSISTSVVNRLMAEYGAVDLRTEQSLDRIETLVKEKVDKGGVLLASSGVHHISFGRAGKDITFGYEKDKVTKKKGPVYIHNAFEDLVARTVSWIKETVSDDLILAINNYVNNGHGFGNDQEREKAVCLLWEKPGRFFIIDQGTKYFDVFGKSADEKMRADIAWNDCPTLGRNYLGKFDHYNYFAVMKGPDKVGTMLYLLTGNANPHPGIAKIEELQGYKSEVK